MAYMSQEHKKEIAAVVNPILKKYGVKGTLSVQNHSTLVLKVRSGKIDFSKYYNQKDLYNNTVTPFNGHVQVNQYHIDNTWTGIACEFLNEVNKAMHGPRFFDHSDAMTDYFHCSHYISINIGEWNKPYVVVD